jgi:hypothetical protein
LLNSRATVFLSCSDRFKEQVARPIRAGLAEYDIFAVIVSEEPLLPRTSGDPDSKVDSYLDASDAFVALCTPDDQLSDGTSQCRQNIISEIERARKTHLRERIQVFKEPTVRLPSNINPTYEQLAVDDISPLTDLIVQQLEAWGVLSRTPRPPRPLASGARPAITVGEMTDGMHFADHEEATRRAYSLLRSQSRQSQETAVESLRQFLHNTPREANEGLLRVSTLLEAISRLDPSLITNDIVEELANEDDTTLRMAAAMLLWDRAEVAPDAVPLGLLGRLALPASEDWYVQAPAMAVVKQLLLHRRAARVVFDALAESDDSDDRYAVAAALLDVARVDPTASPRDLAERLTRDGDRLVAGKAREALEAIGPIREGERDPRSPFGL